MENYDRLIKQKYWEVIKEKYDVENKEQEDLAIRRRRMILMIIEAFQRSRKSP